MLFLKNSIKNYIEDVVIKNSQCKIYGDSPWFESRNYWEPTVQFAIKDICKPGDIVFDIGANLGGLTSLMSRIVGSKGAVCAFEASPRIFKILHSNVIFQGLNNVSLYNKAVFEKSNEVLKVYEGSHLNDSIFSEQSPNKVFKEIKSICLDDFVNMTKLNPSLIKMDIEGAEFSAIKGAINYISSFSPHLILEQQSNDARCFNLLSELDYTCVDLSSYEIINSKIAFSSGDQLKNLLFVHKAKLSELSYTFPISKTHVCQLENSDFFSNKLNGFTSKKIKLNPGRYNLNIQIEANGTENNMMCGIRSYKEVIFRYNAFSKLIAETYSSWIFEIEDFEEIEIYFDFLQNTHDSSLKIYLCNIYCLENVCIPFSSKILT